jgi:hypothetical protein
LVPSVSLRHNLGVSYGDETERTVYIVPHTHWDREWYAPFQIFRAQLVDLWDELLSITEADPDFRFLMDGQTVVIDDYLAIRPESRSRVDRAVGDSQIEVGPWYTLPDEFLVSGETLVRNLQRGMATARLHGGCLEAGYLPDSFGHAAQMPQIYRQFGLGQAVVWRGVPFAIDRLAFRWRAPDGSEVVTAYMANSYSHGVDLPAEPAALAARVQAALVALAPFNPSQDVLLMNGNDHVLPQRELTETVRAANQYLRGVRLKLAGLREYLARLDGTGLPFWDGELRSSARANVLMGTLSVRIPDKQAYFRAGLALERMAEPLAALSCVDCSGLLDQAWTFVQQNAAHDTACGSGIDAVAEEARLRSTAAAQITQAITGRCLPHLAGEEQVWNPSPFPRRGLLEREVEAVPPGAQELPEAQQHVPLHFRFPAEEVGRVHAVLDERRIASEHIWKVNVRREGSTVRVTAETRLAGPTIDLAPSRLEVERLARQPGVEAVEVEIQRRVSRRALVETPVVPGLSVANVGAAPTEAFDRALRASDDWMENDFLRCQLNEDGTIGVEHKATGLVYSGLNRMIDEGDAGDEYNFSPPGVEAGRSGPDLIAPPKRGERGPLRASLHARFGFTVPAGLDIDRRPLTDTARLLIGLTVSLERGSPRLDIRLSVANAARDHRLRVHFPVSFQAPYSSADTAYHVTRRPVTAAHRHPGSPELELPTYPMRSFVDLHGERGGVALITEGLHEYEVIPGPEPRIALTLLRAVGWLSRDDLLYRTGHAGPPLETPAAQVPGMHEFHYSLFFHEGDWEAGGVWRAAEAFLLPLVPGTGNQVSGAAPSIQVEPASIQMTACLPAPDGFELRLLNASSHPQSGLVEIAPAPAQVQRLRLDGAVEEDVRVEGRAVRLSFRSWEIVTLRVRR